MYNYEIIHRKNHKYVYKNEIFDEYIQMLIHLQDTGRVL